MVFATIKTFVILFQQFNDIKKNRSCLYRAHLYYLIPKSCKLIGYIIAIEILTGCFEIKTLIGQNGSDCMNSFYE